MLVLWFALLAGLIIFAIGPGRQGGALTLAYFIGLSLIHVPGVLVFVANASGMAYEQETEIGFELTLMGMIAFVAGAVLAVRTDKNSIGQQRPMSRAAAIELASLGWRFVVVGFLAYFIFVPLSFSVPSLTAGIAALGALLVIGLWLRLHAVFDLRFKLCLEVSLNINRHLGCNNIYFIFEDERDTWLVFLH